MTAPNGRIEPTDQEMFGLGGEALEALAKGKTAKASRAQAEIDRRAHNKAVKRMANHA